MIHGLLYSNATYVFSIQPPVVLNFDFVEAILVELTDEASWIAVLEMSGKNLLCKLARFFDDECVTPLTPRYNG